jgi:hypothetical protein
MRHGLRRVLAVFVVMTLIVGAASARGWERPPPGEPFDPVGAPPPPLPDGKWFPYAPIEVAAATPLPPRQPIENWLRKCNIHCWSCLNCTGCGNCKTECTFIFGSCHAFFGQPCLGPPTSPVPVGGTHPALGSYSPPPGSYGPAPSGCNCR